MADQETTGTDDNTAAVLDALGPPPAQPDEAATPSQVLETVLLRFLARVIHADGEVHTKEMTTLLEIAIQLGLDGGEAKRILDDEFDRKSDVAVLAAQIPDPKMRREAFAMGCVMSCADGEAADAERTVLMEFARGADIPNEDAEGILGKLVEAMENARAQAG